MLYGRQMQGARSDARGSVLVHMTERRASATPQMPPESILDLKSPGSTPGRATEKPLGSGGFFHIWGGRAKCFMAGRCKAREAMREGVCLCT